MYMYINTWSKHHLNKIDLILILMPNRHERCSLSLHILSKISLQFYFVIVPSIFWRNYLHSEKSISSKWCTAKSESFYSSSQLLYPVANYQDFLVVGILCLTVIYLNNTHLVMYCTYCSASCDMSYRLFHVSMYRIISFFWLASNCTQ